MTVASAIDREVVGPTTNITVRASSTDGSVATTAFTIAVGDDFVAYLGTAGDQVLNYSGSTENVNIFAMGGNDSIFGSSFADTIDGGDGDDEIEGNNGDDIILGGLGNDAISGGQGADSMDGGLGDDFLFYGNDVVGVIVNLQWQTATGVLGSEAHGDLIAGFEHAFGGSGNDTITGSGGINHIIGGDGNDLLEGGMGGDLLGGGAGFDLVSYVNDTVGVVVNLALQTATGAVGSEARDDVLSGIEGAIGGLGADTLTGGAAGTELYGWDGDDLLTGGLGDDEIYGGAGHDLINGEGGDDFLEGGVGNDTLLGGLGNDTLVSGGDVGIIDGGADNDAIFIDASALLLPATDILGGSGIDSVTISAGSALSLSDVLGSMSQVELIDFSAPGVSADLSGFNHAAATSLLGASGPGLNLDLVLDGDDVFSISDPVGDGFSFAQAGNVYTFYNSEVLQDATTEIAKVSLI